MTLAASTETVVAVRRARASSRLAWREAKHADALPPRDRDNRLGGCGSVITHRKTPAMAEGGGVSRIRRPTSPA